MNKNKYYVGVTISDKKVDLNFQIDFFSKECDNIKIIKTFLESITSASYHDDDANEYIRKNLNGKRLKSLDSKITNLKDVNLEFKVDFTEDDEALIKIVSINDIDIEDKNITI